MKKILFSLFFLSLTITPKATVENVFELADKDEWDDVFELLDEIHDIPQKLLKLAAKKKSLPEATKLVEKYGAYPYKEKDSRNSAYYILEQHFAINTYEHNPDWEAFKEAAHNY